LSFYVLIMDKTEENGKGQMSEAQKRAAEREERVAAKLRENLRRRKQAARKQKPSQK